MIYLIFWLLSALTGMTEDVPVHVGEVIPESCDLGEALCGEDSTPPPSELPGPPETGGLPIMRPDT